VRDWRACSKEEKVLGRGGGRYWWCDLHISSFRNHISFLLKDERERNHITVARWRWELVTPFTYPFNWGICGGRGSSSSSASD